MAENLLFKLVPITSFKPMSCVPNTALLKLYKIKYLPAAYIIEHKIAQKKEHNNKGTQNQSSNNEGMENLSEERHTFFGKIQGRLLLS